MRKLFIYSNADYLRKRGTYISDAIIASLNKNQLPELDDLIAFSNETGISINDFLFVDIKQNVKLI